MLKRTSLYEAHISSGARVIEFGGWEMPVQYSGIVDEHHTVRTAVGLFDISHMGEVFVSGSAAEGFLNAVLSNDVRKLEVGLGQYTLMCRPDGGVVDDLYVFRVGALEYLLIINASRIEADVAWLRSCWAGFSGRSEVVLNDQSEQWSAVALQGPKAGEMIDACVDWEAGGGRRPSELKKNQILQICGAGFTAYVSRTGYTGEDGFEIVMPNDRAREVWDRTIAAGRSSGLKPVGLGARDTLRTEACYPLYGHELNETTTPIEAGLGFFVSLDKGEFNGRSILVGQKTGGVTRKSVAFRMTDRSAPPRQHYAIVSSAGQKIGEVTSGTQSPTLNVGIGMGMVVPELAKPGTPVQIEIRGKLYPAVVVSKPFYKRA